MSVAGDTSELVRAHASCHGPQTRRCAPLRRASLGEADDDGRKVREPLPSGGAPRRSHRRSGTECASQSPLRLPTAPAQKHLRIWGARARRRACHAQNGWAERRTRVRGYRERHATRAVPMCTDGSGRVRCHRTLRPKGWHCAAPRKPHNRHARKPSGCTGASILRYAGPGPAVAARAQSGRAAPAHTPPTRLPRRRRPRAAGSGARGRQ
jgi:hypothetical protein